MDELDRVILYSQVLNIITPSALYKELPAVSSVHRLPPATISAFLCTTTAIWNWITRYPRQTAASSSSQTKDDKPCPTSVVMRSLTTLCPSHGFSNQGFAEFQWNAVKLGFKHFLLPRKRRLLLILIASRNDRVEDREIGSIKQCTFPRRTEIPFWKMEHEADAKWISLPHGYTPRVQFDIVPH